MRTIFRVAPRTLAVCLLAGISVSPSFADPRPDDACKAFAWPLQRERLADEA